MKRNHQILGLIILTITTSLSLIGCQKGAIEHIAKTDETKTDHAATSDISQSTQNQSNDASSAQEADKLINHNDPTIQFDEIAQHRDDHYFLKTTLGEYDEFDGNDVIYAYDDALNADSEQIIVTSRELGGGTISRYVVGDGNLYVQSAFENECYLYSIDLTSQDHTPVFIIGYNDGSLQIDDLTFQSIDNLSYDHDAKELNIYWTASASSGDDFHYVNGKTTYNGKDFESFENVKPLADTIPKDYGYQVMFLYDDPDSNYYGHYSYKKNDDNQWKEVEPKLLSGSIVGYFADSFVLVDHENSALLLIDTNTGETKSISIKDQNLHASMFSSTLDQLYMKAIPYEDGSTETLSDTSMIYSFDPETATFELFLDLTDQSDIWSMICTAGDYVFYHQTQDYDSYIFAANLDTKQVHKLALTQPTHIAEVGHLESIEDHVYWDDGVTAIAEITANKLIVDTDIPGKDNINASLSDIYQAQIEGYRNDLQSSLDDGSIPSQNDLQKDEWQWYINNSLSLNVDKITYFDEQYLSFYINGYDYPAGAAHGMPYHINLIYDCQTGEQLHITDVVNNSEDDIHQIIVDAYSELFDAQKGYYWDDALDTVKDYGLDSFNIYMANDGFRVCADPYVLGSYADGFVGVTIPYEKFSMK